MREPAPFLARMIEVSFWAVKWLMFRLSPTYLSDSPAATRWRTVNSRKLSPWGRYLGEAPPRLLARDCATISGSTDSR